MQEVGAPKPLIVQGSTALERAVQTALWRTDERWVGAWEPREPVKRLVQFMELCTKNVGIFLYKNYTSALKYENKRLSQWFT